MLVFHDPLRGRVVRLREDNLNEIERYKAWGWVPEEEVKTVEPEEALPDEPLVHRAPTKAAAKRAADAKEAKESK